MANLAKIPQTIPDTPPPIWAPGAMDGAPPDLGPPPAPTVSRIPTMGEQNIAHDEAKLQKVQWNQEHPWGTPENHPGKLGKVAHAFSTLGNIAGNIVAPNVMANVPGTQMNMQQQEGTLAKRVNQEQGEESQNQYRGAEQAKTEETTREAPAKAASEEAYQGAETGKIQGETAQGPDMAHAYAHAVNQALKENRDPAQDPIVQHLADAITSIQRQPAPKEDASKTIDLLGPDHKEHQMGWNAKTGKYDIDMGLKGEKPTQAPGITMVIPNAEGGGTVQRLTAGSQVAPGAMSGTQFGSLNTPTTQQRNVGAQAKLVSEQMPGLINEIQQNAALLGPVSGRWNEFMQGKVGVDNPQMAGLRADLLMMSSAVALMHARGRLPENLREEFDRAINAPKQTPQNLISTLNHINQWTTANMHAMGEHGGAQPEPKVLKFNQSTGRLE